MRPLETERLILRPFTEEDAANLYAYASHPEVGPWAGWKPHADEAESLRVIREIFLPSDTLAVIQKSDGRLIGSAGFVGKHRTELGTPSEEVGYSLARDCWGQGLIPEAVEAILRHAFMEEGYADIAIVEGDGASQTSSSGSAQASSKKITVGSEEYTIASDFPENALPSGFAAADITYDGETVKGAKQEKGDLQLLYLLDSSNQGAFYIYNESKNACSPMQMINLSETSSIILLDDVEDVELPARYTKVELEISDDHSVPAWHDSKNDRFYLLYTVNTDGEKALYKYDSKDQTYQYYGQPTSAASASADTPSGIIGKITTFAGDHIEYVLIGAAFAILIFLLLIIILAVKLHRRNLELDDVYDELDELNGKKEGKAAEAVPEVHQEIPEPSLAKDVREEEPAQDDDFDDFESYDEDFEEEYDETYDDYEDEDYDDYDDYEDEDYEEDYDSDYYDDDYENYEEEYEERRPVRKQSRTSARKVKKQENDDDDDFSIDFIDL